MAISSPSFLILETILTDFHKQIVDSSLVWEAGYMLKPNAPGLGVELNESVVSAHPVSDSLALHLEMCQYPLSSDNRLTISELQDREKK